MASAPPPHTIVLAIDGLRASALGAYGATSHATPSFDAFASEARLWDWAYADTPAIDTLYARLAETLAPAIGDSSLLVHDSDEQPLGVFADAFARRERVVGPEPTDVASSVGETSQAAVWSGFAEHLADAATRLDDDRPLVAWLHTRGLYGPWDAPPASYEPLVDEDDPEIEPSVEPAEAVFDDATSDAACDARFAASCRYAGQVATLDACLAGWLDVVDGLFEGRPLRVILFGLRGYPLGEHGRIGGVDERLFSEQQHVPVLVRSPDPAERFARGSRPTTLTAAVRQLFVCDQNRDKSDVLFASNEARVLVGVERFLRAPADPAAAAELYVKPDDRWEQNDIASLEEDRTQEMLAAMAAASRFADDSA